MFKGAANARHASLALFAAATGGLAPRAAHLNARATNSLDASVFEVITRDAEPVGVATLTFGRVALAVLYATRGRPAFAPAAHLPLAATNGRRNSIDDLFAAGALRTAKSTAAPLESLRAAIFKRSRDEALLVFFTTCIVATFLRFLAVGHAISVNAIFAFSASFFRPAAAAGLLTTSRLSAAERTILHVPVADSVEADLAVPAVAGAGAARRLLAGPAAAYLVGLAGTCALAFEAGLALAQIAVGVELAARQGLTIVVLAALVAFAYADALVLRLAREGRYAPVAAYFALAAVVVGRAAGRRTTFAVATIHVEGIAEGYAAAAATCVALRAVELRFAARDSRHALVPAAGLVGLALAYARAVAALLARSAVAVGVAAFFLTSAVAAPLALRTLVFALTVHASAALPAVIVLLAAREITARPRTAVLVCSASLLACLEG